MKSLPIRTSPLGRYVAILSFSLVFYSVVLTVIGAVVWFYQHLEPLSTIFFPLIVLTAQVLRLATGPGELVIEKLLAGDSASSVRELTLDDFLDRLVAVAVERGLVIVWTAVLFLPVVAVGLASGTAWGYWQAARDVFAPQSSFLTLFLVGLTPVILGSVVAVPYRVGTVRSGDGKPVRAPTTGWATLRSNPVALGILLLCRTTPWLTLTVAGTLYYGVAVPVYEPRLYGLPLETLRSLAAPSLVASPILFVVGSLIATTIQHRIHASSTSPEHFTAVRSVFPSVRILIVVFLIVGVFGGPAVSMRITDQKPSISYAEPVSESAPPTEVLDRAILASQEVDHYRSSTHWQYNETTGRWDKLADGFVGIDYGDKQVLLGEGTKAEHTYSKLHSDGATLFHTRQLYPKVAGGFIVSYHGNWTAASHPEGSNHPLVSPWVYRYYIYLAPSGTDLHVASTTDQTITYELTNRTQLANEFGYADSPENVSTDSFIRVTVSRETGYFRTVEYYRNVTVWGGDTERTRTVQRYSDWETYDAGRPDAVPQRSLLELYFDALGY